jgi:D-alanyl-D-alanine carboxypeptidase
LVITGGTADARHHRRVRVHYVHSGHGSGRVHHAHAEGYSPPSASIMVDGNTGQVLEASNPDAPRHPASLTKIMTLYLLFERLDAGKIKLDTPLKVSQHAADQDPTKLELKPGQTIPIEEAIKGVVTRSANDAAVTIAENLGGSESDFAKLMTQQAHALGMSRTTYVNASGLPDDDQITTARDQALLGRAIQDRFPRYYKYFSLPSFVYHGETIRNHDHLLGSVDGVDGIKTGFTRASGFNLVTSVHRDGRYVVAVVLAGRSGPERDAHMRALIGEHIKEASLHRMAPIIAELAPQHEEAQPVAFAKAPMSSSHANLAPVATATVNTHAAATDPIQPLQVKTVSYRIAPMQTAQLAPMPALVPVAARSAQPAATPIVLPRPGAPVVEAPRTVVASAEPIATVAPAPSESAKSDLAPAYRSQAEPAKSVAAKSEPANPEPARSQTAKLEAPKAETASAEPARIHARGGWLLQCSNTVPACSWGVYSRR